MPQKVSENGFTLKTKLGERRGTGIKNAYESSGKFL